MSQSKDGLESVTAKEQTAGVLAVLAVSSSFFAYIDYSLGNWKQSVLQRALNEFLKDPFLILPIFWVGLIMTGLNNYVKSMSFEKGVKPLEIAAHTILTLA